MTTSRRFTAFHRANPHVFDKFRYVACQLRKDQDRGSAEQVYQILRWEMRFETRDMSSRFKLNNYYRKHYARLLVKVDPSFKGWFRFRKQRKVRK